MLRVVLTFVRYNSFYFRFIYTDDVEFDNHSAMKLYQAARKYKINDLMGLCFMRMSAGLSRENVCIVLKMAYDLGNSDVKINALDYFCRCAEELVELEGIFELPQSCLIDILKSDKLKISEEKKYELAIFWAEGHCRQQNREVNDANLKDLLAPVVNFIKFEDMSLEYFNNCVSKRNVLEQTMIICIFQKLVSKPQTRLSNSPSSSARGAVGVNQSASLSDRRSANEPSTSLPADSTTTENLSQSLLNSSSMPQMERDPSSSSVLAIGRQGPTPIPPRGNNTNNNRAQPARQQTGAQPLPNNFTDEMGRITIWRFGGLLSGKAYLRDNIDAISIIPSHSGKLHGIYLYGSHQRQATYKVNIKILEDGIVKRAIPNRDIVSDGREKVHLLTIDPPMNFVLDNVYTVEMVMKGPTSYYGKTGRDMVTEGDVTFTFIPNDNGLNGTNTEIGQFPGFVFEKTVS